MPPLHSFLSQFPAVHPLRRLLQTAGGGAAQAGGVLEGPQLISRCSLPTLTSYIIFQGLRDG